MPFQNITLCAVSSANIELTKRSIEICRSKFSFGDTVFVTNAEVNADYRVEKCPVFPTRMESWNWAFHNLSGLFKTSHILFVQWDGYIINPESWRDDFLSYDYIGARWPWIRDGKTVGNGGFCLRSLRLIKALEEFPLPNERPEDDYVCRTIRTDLEAKGFLFAPENVADCFAIERAELTERPFGFHGIFNFPKVIDDADFIAMLPYFEDYVINSDSYRDLALDYSKMGKENIVRIMIERKHLGASSTV